MKSSAYHLSIAVSDGARSKEFYYALLKELGWKMIYEDEAAAGYSDGTFTLWVIPAKQKETKHKFHSVGFHHFALRVPDAESVDAIYEWCKARNIEIVDPPAKYPQYTPTYYAVFFLDPDGMKIEVVHNPPVE